MYTIARAKKTIKEGMEAYLMKDENGNYLMKEVNCLPIYLEGAPGIGKTEIVSQIAEEMNLGFVNFSLVHHTRNSLLGLPVIKELDNGDKFTSYTMSEIIAKVNESIEAGHEEGILLLDEFPCMSESVMPAMLAFLQTKNIGTHTLPRGWVLVLCGNPAKYNKSTHSFDAAVTDRIRKIEIEYSNNDFLTYAKEKQFMPEIITYIELHPDHMYRFNNIKDHSELVTCRGWENLSHILSSYQKLGLVVDEALIHQYLKSELVATEFAEYYRQMNCGMTENERGAIFGGKGIEKIAGKYVDKTFETKWNITAFLMGYMKSQALNYEKAENIIKYTKAVLDHIDVEVHQDDPFGPSDYSYSEALRKICMADDLRTIRRSANILLPYDCESWDESVIEEMLLKWKSAMENYRGNAPKKSEFDEYNVYFAAIEKWVKDYEKALEKEQITLSTSIDNMFGFLKLIDPNETLMERLYLEISNSPALLKNVCKVNSEMYAQMCKKQYGVVS